MCEWAVTKTQTITQTEYIVSAFFTYEGISFQLGIAKLNHKLPHHFMQIVIILRWFTYTSTGNNRRDCRVLLHKILYFLINIWQVYTSTPETVFPINVPVGRLNMRQTNLPGGQSAETFIFYNFLLVWHNYLDISFKHSYLAYQSWSSFHWHHWRFWRYACTYCPMRWWGCRSSPPCSNVRQTWWEGTSHREDWPNPVTKIIYAVI